MRDCWAGRPCERLVGVSVMTLTAAKSRSALTMGMSSASPDGLETLPSGMCAETCREVGVGAFDGLDDLSEVKQRRNVRARQQQRHGSSISVGLGTASQGRCRDDCGPVRATARVRYFPCVPHISDPSIDMRQGGLRPYLLPNSLSTMRKFADDSAAATVSGGHKAAC